jgi:hypothetical protein
VRVASPYLRVGACPIFMLSPQSRQLAAEFLAWLKEERQHTLRLLKMWCLVESALEKQWTEQNFSNPHTERWLALVEQQRKELEYLLNIIDFGAQYGVDFESPARMELFRQWAARKNTTPRN